MSLLGTIKAFGSAIGIYDPAKLKQDELKKAKSINEEIKFRVTKAVTPFAALSPLAGGIAGGILGGFGGAAAGTALGTSASAYTLGVTKYPTQTEKATSKVVDFGRSYAETFAKNPLETSTATGLTLLGIGLGFGAAVKGATTYITTKAGTKSALDDLGFSSANNFPPLSPQDSPTATPKGKKDKNASPIPRGEELINPPASPLDANMGATVPTEGSTTKAKTRRRSVRRKPQDINIRNTVKVYNDIYN